MKKRILAVILVLGLFLLTACGSGTRVTGPGCDDAVDKAFAAGKIVLAEKAVPMPDPDKCRIELPAQDQFPEGLTCPDEETVRRVLREGRLAIIAYSPDGRTAVCSVELEEEGLQLPLVFSGDRVTMIRPTVSRGAEDPSGILLGNYTRYFYRSGPGSRAIKLPLWQESGTVAWSPDGRWCFAGGYMESIIRTIVCNAILDTTTGELIPLDTFDSRFSQDNYGTVLSGCFSGDGKYFYGTVMSNKYGPFAVVRYDLASFRASVVSQTENVLIPSPVMLRNGEILGIRETNAAREKSVILWLGSDGVKKTVEYPLSSHLWRGRQLLYSPESGYAVAWQRSVLVDEYATRNLGGSGLSVFRPDEGNADGLDRALFIDNDTGELKEKPVSDIYDDRPEETSGFWYQEFDHRPYMFLDTVLSPNGRYAALLAWNRETYDLTLFVIRLEDKAYLVAEGLNVFDSGSRKPRYVSLATRLDNNRPVLAWTTEGILTIGDSVQLWEIQ